jgi:hypothetical protein
VNEAVAQEDWLFLTDSLGWRFGRFATTRENPPRSRLEGAGARIRLEPRIDTANLSEEIARALHSSQFNPSNVKITADGGKIRLTGYVNSGDDRALAASTAWAAPGATLVEDDLVIGLEA